MFRVRCVALAVISQKIFWLELIIGRSIRPQIFKLNLIFAHHVATSTPHVFNKKKIFYGMVLFADLESIWPQIWDESLSLYRGRVDPCFRRGAFSGHVYRFLVGVDANPIL